MCFFLVFIHIEDLRKGVHQVSVILCYTWCLVQLLSSCITDSLTQLRLDACLFVICRCSNHIQERDEMEQKPVFTVEGVTFVYVQYNNLILMSVTKRNSNVALMLVYLYKLVSRSSGL